MGPILVILDTIENKLPASAFELLTFAEALAHEQGLSVQIVIAGDDVGEISEKMARFGHDVIGLEHGLFRYPNPDLLARESARIIEEFHANSACFQHTVRGCQAAARISVLAGLSCITGIESFTISGNGVSFRRSILNGKINIDLVPGADRSAFTVIPGAYRAPDAAARKTSPGRSEKRRIDAEAPPSRPLEIRESEGENVRLEESDVIISAGRGIGLRENLELIRSVARLFPNSAVGASRTICDQKWLPYAHQVGVTGKTVAPKLYMACGISGAQQHIAGMKGSQTIVAINKDPQAAIFSIADYIIVEDLTTFLPVLIETYEKSK